MKKRILIFFLLLFLFLPACFVIRSFKSENVISFGMAPIYHNNISDARKIAIMDALKEALHKVLGVHISQDIEVSKSILLDENILSNTNGYIEKYKILKEEKNNDFYKVKLKSKVNKKIPDLNIIKKQNFNYKKIGNPKIFIDIKEYIDDIVSNINVSKSLISSYFLDKKIIVLEKNENANIFIYGEVKNSFIFDIKGLVSYLSKIDIKVLNNRNGEIIKVYNFETKGIGINKDEAARKAMKKGMNSILKTIYDDIYNYFDKNILLEIFVSKNDIEDLKKIKSLLQRIPNVKEVTIKNFEKEKSIINVYCKNSDIENFIENLSKMDDFVIKKISSFEIFLEKKEA